MSKALVAEFLGTFALVFIGAGSVVVDNSSGGQVGLVGVALAHALVLSVMVTATMPVSGGHLNPAVTFALWVARKIRGRDGLLYVAAQLAASVVAAFAIRWLLPSAAGATTAYGLPRVAADLTFAQAVLLEAILTLFLVSAVFGTAVSSQAPRVGGFGIGLVLLFDILVGGPLTGAAVNPARAFGPAVASADWHAQAVYWVGPLLGGAGSALIWSVALLPKDAGS